MLNVAYPNDVEVLSYLGRCYAREGDWTQTEKYFKSAIASATSQGEDTWYLYRDWGHLNVRFDMPEDAQKNFFPQHEPCCNRNAAWKTMQVY